MGRSRSASRNRRSTTAATTATTAADPVDPVETVETAQTLVKAPLVAVDGNDASKPFVEQVLNVSPPSLESTSIPAPPPTTNTTATTTTTTSTTTNATSSTTTTTTGDLAGLRMSRSKSSSPLTTAVSYLSAESQFFSSQQALLPAIATQPIPQTVVQPTRNPLPMTSPSRSPPLEYSSEDTAEHATNLHSVQLTPEEADLLRRLEQQNRLFLQQAAMKARPSSAIVNAELSAAEPSPAVTADTPLLPAQPPTLRPSGSSVSSSEDLDTDWEFWGKLLGDFDAGIRKSNRALVKKVQGGLPRTLRGSLWMHFARAHPQSFLLQAGSPPEGGEPMPEEQPQPQQPSASPSEFQPPAFFAQLALEDVYLELLKLSSPYEKMIIRDLARTFPKHKFFQDAEGKGQESLFNVMKAYSLYDPEVGYCQGLSFIVGTLLLNMPDEESFACLVHLMHTYRIRGLFTPRMEQLQLRLYQFDRLLQELLPRVHAHLEQQGIRSTMYASQWFLTLFAYRFPLDLVFRVMDLLFASGVVPGVATSEGMMDLMMERVSESVAAVASGSSSGRSATSNGGDGGVDCAIVIFRIAFALLKRNEGMLLALEFEPLLEFLKHGLFDIYIASGSQSQQHLDIHGTQQHTLANSFGLGENGETPPQIERSRTHAHSPTPANTNNIAQHLANRHRPVEKRALDDLIKEAVSSQLKLISKKRLQSLRKDYEEEMRKLDPTYLAEKSLQAQNQRLFSELKRTEKMLAELNRDHVGLASQLVSLRLELAQEKEMNGNLRRQVHDLKAVLDAQQLQQQMDQQAQDAEEHVSVNGEGPTDEEQQIDILLRQNAALMEEVQMWRSHGQTVRERRLSANPVNGAAKRQ